MLGDELCSVFILCQLRAGEVSEGGGGKERRERGGLPKHALWKNSTRGGRGHAASWEATVLNREVVNPV